MSVSKGRAEYAALHNLLSTTPRAFSLNVAIAPPGIRRERALAYFLDEFPSVAEVHLPTQCDDVFTSVFSVAPPGPRDAVFVHGLDCVSPDDTLIAKLNASPRRWRAWYAYPIVFWIEAESVDPLRESARDYWEWVTGVFRFDLEA